MKRKMIAVLFLVVVSLGVLVVEGVSQPTSTPLSSQSAPPIAGVAPPAPVSPAAPDVNFSIVRPPQREWTFEQLVAALKEVRARQKELQAQEADLLAKMEEKIVDKRKALNMAERVLQQLRSEPSIHPVRKKDFDKGAAERMDFDKDKDKKR